VALLIVAAVGAATFVPAWVGVLALVVGAGATVLAVRLWRGFLAAARERGR
jgi:hypothetical protein